MPRDSKEYLPYAECHNKNFIDASNFEGKTSALYEALSSTEPFDSVQYLQLLLNIKESCNTKFLFCFIKFDK